MTRLTRIASRIAVESLEFGAGIAVGFFDGYGQPLAPLTKYPAAAAPAALQGIFSAVTYSQMYKAKIAAQNTQKKPELVNMLVEHRFRDSAPEEREAKKREIAEGVGELLDELERIVPDKKTVAAKCLKSALCVAVKTGAGYAAGYLMGYLAKNGV